MYLELNDDFLEKNDIFHVDEYTTEALWEIIKIVQEDCEELEVGHPRRLLPQNLFARIKATVFQFVVCTWLNGIIILSKSIPYMCFLGLPALGFCCSCIFVLGFSPSNIPCLFFINPPLKICKLSKSPLYRQSPLYICFS